MLLVVEALESIITKFYTLSLAAKMVKVRSLAIQGNVNEMIGDDTNVLGTAPEAVRVAELSAKVMLNTIATCRENETPTPCTNDFLAMERVKRSRGRNRTCAFRGSLRIFTICSPDRSF